ncbi:fimbrial protein [Klebsiella aerogenes]|uniref:fimbrial protein n=1 Tax=Klebsiella aerogenes TaxID=548 RepID=UPI003D313FBD
MKKIKRSFDLVGFNLLRCDCYHLINNGLIYMTILLFCFYSAVVEAGACVVTDKNGVENGDVASGNVNLSSVFNIPDDNVVGVTKDITIENNVEKKQAACTCESGDSTSLWDWTRFEVPTEDFGGLTYGIINDYLGIGILAGDSDEKKWIPYEKHEHKSGKSVCNNINHNTTTTGGGGYSARIRIRKRIVGEIYIPPTLVYTKGSNTYVSDNLRKPEIHYFFHGSIKVPQSCELDAGQIVEINFGSIGASLFSQAGAGKKPAGVNPISRNIHIQCKNIDAQSILSLRIEAEDTTGDIMISNNQDIGFIISDKNGNPLTPNNINSKINFKLNDNASADVIISAYPVSITGRKPAEGLFAARGYLRVDFE